MPLAKRRPTLRAVMTGIACLALILAAPRISPAFEVLAVMGGTLLAGLAVALYVPAYPVGKSRLDEILMAGLVLAMALGAVGSSQRGSRCGAVVAPGALSAAAGPWGLAPNKANAALDPFTCRQAWLSPSNAPPPRPERLPDSR